MGMGGPGGAVGTQGCAWVGFSAPALLQTHSPPFYEVPVGDALTT